MLKQGLDNVFRHTEDAHIAGQVAELEQAQAQLAATQHVVRSLADVQRVFTTVLGRWFPGQDVKYRAATRENREILEGWWMWNMVDMRHEKKAASAVFNAKSGIDQKAFRKNVRRRKWRWKDICKMYKEITGLDVVKADDYRAYQHGGYTDRPW